MFAPGAIGAVTTGAKRFETPPPSSGVLRVQTGCGNHDNQNTDETLHEFTLKRLADTRLAVSF
jgi:hypothetical protein